MIVTRPQFEMFTGTGATKSLTSAGNEADERLFRNALPNALQVPCGKTPEPVRLIAASPNVSAAKLRGLFGGIGSVTVPVLMAPSEFAAFSAMWSPQQGNLLLEKQTFGEKPGTTGVVALVSHVFSPRTGLVPPLVKSYVTSRSPAVRLIVCGPGLPRPGVTAWLISKSMFADPRTLVRSQAR